MREVRLERKPLEKRERLPPWWTDLLGRSKYSSFFLSPEWVGSWVETYGKDFELEWVSWADHGQVVAGCLLARRRVFVGPCPIRLLALNTAGEDAFETPFVEFNDVLCEAGYEEAVARSLVDTLTTTRWHQFLLCGIEKASVAGRMVAMDLPASWSSSIRESPYVDLARVREAGYDGLLSGNTRSKLRRSIKEYAGRGVLGVDTPQDLAECLRYFDKLVALHRLSWAARGKQGAFVNDKVINFHEALIEKGWKSKRAEVIRIFCGNDDVGYLYNFLYKGKVYFYQSGLAYEKANTIRPGLVAHYLTVQHYADRQFIEYDFLAGEARYKTSLATNQRSLGWYTADRKTLLMGLLKLLKKAKGMACSHVHD